MGGDKNITIMDTKWGKT